MLHGLTYIALSSVLLFEGKHHDIRNAANIKDQTSRERVLRWIAKSIASDGEYASSLTTTPTTTAKATLTFPAKVWWVVVRAHLRPMANDNTLSLSLALLIE